MHGNLNRLSIETELEDIAITTAATVSTIDERRQYTLYRDHAKLFPYLLNLFIREQGDGGTRIQDGISVEVGQIQNVLPIRVQQVKAQ